MIDLTQPATLAQLTYLGEGIVVSLGITDNQAD
jgi:hypothetical protein